MAGSKPAGASCRHSRHAKFEADWRIYARSASDDKSPIVALARRSMRLKAAGLQPTSNLRVILDGEEEAGSASLVPAIAKYRDKLTADIMLIFDGPVHPSEKPTLVFGARGITTITLTVYGPKFPLHSGHYGNWVPNPAMRLAQLLATFKDENGRVQVAGFYDGIAPLTADERPCWPPSRTIPSVLKRFFGFARPENRQLPSRKPSAPQLQRPRAAERVRRAPRRAPSSRTRRWPPSTSDSSRRPVRQR